MKKMIPIKFIGLILFPLYSISAAGLRNRDTFPHSSSAGSILAVDSNNDTTVICIDDNKTMLQAFEWYSLGGGTFWNDFKSKSVNLAEIGITGK